MIYREAGQFKTSYGADQAVFPIWQDRWFVLLGVAAAFIVPPLLADEYWLQAVLIPLLVYALAAIGLNLLTGYAGQLSLGTGGFMAVGAYSAFKLTTAFPQVNILLVFLLSGLVAAGVGLVFGIPSLRIKGFYLAVATLASLLIPLFGIGVLFVGFSLAFWGAIYLIFTPHGMVRHRLGLVSAVRESVDLVRWNLLGTTALLALLLSVDRLTGLIWLLPDPGTWYAGLAVLGHAFVSAMLVAASYAFYAGRREWWQTMRQLRVVAQASSGSVEE